MRLVSRKDQLRQITAAIDALGDDITILEAGCGRQWPLDLSVRYRLVGLDADAAALRARVDRHGDLDEHFVGDLRDADFEPGSFDVVYCSYVLEHVTDVDEVLANFARWIRPGGLIVLRIPDRNSVYSFIARCTPHWFHVAACKHINKNKNAGKPGHAPYPVVYENAMSRAGIARFCEAHGFTPTVSAVAAYKRWWIKPAALLVSLLTLGRLAWRHNNLTYVINAGEAQAPAAARGAKASAGGRAAAAG